MENTTVVTPQYPDFGALLESIKENGRRMDENYARYLAERKEQEAKWQAERKEQEAKWQAERREQEAERKEQEAKWQAKMQASKDFSDMISADINRTIKELRDYFITPWGQLVEALCKPAAYQLFKKHGIEIDYAYEGIHRLKADEDIMEIDVALCDTSVAVIVEVKTHCGRKEIDHFLKQMKRCKEWYPDFADKDLRVAVAAIQYNDGVEKYALKHGLYVLTLSGEDTFTMSAPEKPEVF